MVVEKSIKGFCGDHRKSLDTMAIAKKVLEDLGLSEKEAKVYLTLLELGASPVQKIASKASVNRATTYVCLEALLKLGLVSTVQKGVKTYYTPENPEQLQSLIFKKEKEVERKREELLKVIPELSKIFEAAGERPVVRFYEGVDGIRSIRDDFLASSRKGDTILGFSSLSDVYRVLPSQDKEYREIRIKKGIKSKGIYTHKNGPLSGSGKDPGLLRELRFIPYNKFPFKSDITIYGKNKIALTSYTGSLVGVVIENNDLYNSFVAIFNLAWEAAEKYIKEK
uniref:TrmB family transcriptional regulator n=1 Tax=candidate division CPR3 bacterium TaxID=2268181 RepID=A0A7C4M0C2_UNCC3